MFLSPPVAAALLAYDWPGTSGSSRIVSSERWRSPDWITSARKISRRRSSASRAPRGRHPTEEPGEILTLDEVDRRYIERTLVALHGNKSLAASLLGLDRRTLYRRLEKYESEPERPHPRCEALSFRVNRLA